MHAGGCARTFMRRRGCQPSAATEMCTSMLPAMLMALSISVAAKPKPQ